MQLSLNPWNFQVLEKLKDCVCVCVSHASDDES